MASPATVRLKPEPAQETAIWAFDGKSAPPVLRVKLGGSVRLRVENRTERPLSLHWHGVRNQNAMDGVGGETQAPIAPGASFTYAFTPPDAGTFLVRPLVVGGASEPSGRGLAGFLVVEEKVPPAIDRDVPLLMQDWRLQDDGSLLPFGQTAFAAAGGRLGNLVTVNGRPAPEAIEARPCSRLRLRLGNACNARATRIRFDGLKVYVAGVDGQPTDTFEPLRATLPFPPAPATTSSWISPRRPGRRQRHGPRRQRPRPGDPDGQRRAHHREAAADRPDRRQQVAPGRGEAAERGAARRDDHGRRHARQGQARG